VLDYGNSVLERAIPSSTGLADGGGSATHGSVLADG
jgi:hypothetical protein